MLQTRRDVIRVARRSYRTSQRRHASSEQPPGTSTSHQADAGKHEPTHHAPHPEPVDESFGRGFYLTLAALPLSFAFYKFSRSSDGSTADSAQPLFTRIINQFTSYEKSWTDRNALHTSMIEQAAHDRNLFQSSPGSKMVDLKFPEVFNTGSPYNIPAGHSANLDQLIAHYRRKNVDAEEKRAAKMEAEKGGRDPEKEIVRLGTY